MKKQYKEYYRVIKKPQILEIPRIPIISIKGHGNPNDNPVFSEHISCLYQLSYSFRMSYKNDPIPGYQEYTVGPLEGFWSTIDNQMYDQDKAKLTYEIFIIQPDFITEDIFFAHQSKMVVKNPQIKDVEFKYINEGLVGQILHVGPFDTEPESIAILEQYLEEQGYEIVPDSHHEIYLSDFRKVSSDKYKTLIRYKIKKV